MDVSGWIVAGLSLLLGFGAAGVAWFAMRRSLSLEDRLRNEASSALAKGRADFMSLAESVEEMIEEARVQRKRADGAKGGRPPRAAAPEQNGGEAWTREKYLLHVERTGRSIPEVEAALGL